MPESREGEVTTEGQCVQKRKRSRKMQVPGKAVCKDLAKEADNSFKKELPTETQKIWEDGRRKEPLHWIHQVPLVDREHLTDAFSTTHTG